MTAKLATKERVYSTIIMMLRKGIKPSLERIASKLGICSETVRFHVLSLAKMKLIKKDKYGHIIGAK